MAHMRLCPGPWLGCLGPCTSLDSRLKLPYHGASFLAPALEEDKVFQILVHYIPSLSPKPKNNMP